ncbi:MAG TPA: histidine triad nucleotide-binding protein [Verrucomicrobiae bacterium]|jgi:histidine triad (HIT) family protein|nr:histidine triad nucleotide-binding protein [Verrucomicrobiae bacterium]
MSRTLFEKIVAREIPATIIYEDEWVMGIKDINPQAPTHLLIFPKKAIPRIAEATPEDGKILSHLLFKASEIAQKAGLSRDGFRLVINNGPNGGETVPHLHVHILGGRRMQWPPG